MSEIKESAQIKFMAQLKSAMPSNISIVDELADLLNVSNDSAYRRMRGETSLTIDEIAIICKKFKISFDSFIQQEDSAYVNFKYNPMGVNNTGFQDYFTGMLADLEHVAKFEDKQIIFAAEDIPVFHHFAYPELTSFKMFYWNKSIIGAPGFEDKKFSLDAINYELKDIAKSILETYSHIPSIEIWSDDTVNSTFKQIEFYWDSGIFESKETALLICELVGKIINRIKLQAEMSTKIGLNGEKIGKENSYQLYQSDVMIGNNCVLVDVAGNKSTYLSYHTFNTILTSHPNFCEETDFWLKNLIKKSNLISGVAEKNRYRYFKKIEDTLAKIVAKIESE
jgi:hypothetical protein